MMTWHIASLVVRCRPERLRQVQAALDRLPEVNVRGAEGGRLVVLVEGDSERVLAERFDAIRSHPDILSADLVHHQIDADDATSHEHEANHVPITP